VVPPDDGTLFLAVTGEELSPNRLTQLVRNYVNAADTGKKGACHLFRHTMATVMLENGADIRYIQELLGHVELSTTQIYTQVSIKKLQAVHALTHPTARLERREPVTVEPQPEGPAIAKASATVDELFSRLAAEDDDDAAQDERPARHCG
jgi:integrase/recombinase XerD